MDLSVILSFRNEEQTIVEMVRRLHAALGPTRIDYEIIYVNDASTDRSLELLTELSRSDRRVKVINMSRNWGISPCALAGFKYSTGKAAVILDADLQDPPELLPTLYEEFKKGADVVYTIRKRRPGESPLRLLATKLAYRVIAWMSRPSFPVEAGDFKLLSRRAIDELLRLGDHEPYLRGLMLWIGFKQVPVYYERAPRFAGKSHFPLWMFGNPARTFVAAITGFSEVPLYALFFGGFIGFGLLAVAIGVGAAARLSGAFTSPVSDLAILGIALASIQLLSTGILGIYLGKIHEGAKRRPLFIVDSFVGFSQSAMRELETNASRSVAAAKRG